VNRLKSRYRMVDLIPIKSDPSLTVNDQRDTDIHLADFTFDDQEEAKRNLQKYTNCICAPAALLVHLEQI
jgi:hypothetical protein